MTDTATIRRLLNSFGLQKEEELDLARAIATEVLEVYGDLTVEQWEHFYRHGIWNDDPSVQAALVAIRLSRRQGDEA